MKLFFTLLFSSAFLFASSAFITPDELRQAMNKEKIILLDTSDSATYKQGHIPTALHVDINDFRHKKEQYQLMNSPQQIQKTARSLGINKNSKVVLYGHNKPKELLKASYIAMALIANGLKDVAILDGGYHEWLFHYEGFTSTESLPVKKGNFIAKFNPNILVDLDYVKKNIGKIPMIEARPLRFYNAKAQSSGVRRLGHIKGATSSAWADKLDNDYCIKPKKELREIYKLNPKKEVITYCTGGLEASMNWYILSQYLHFKDVKLYDASMREWGNRDDTPMEK